MIIFIIVIRSAIAISFIIASIYAIVHAYVVTSANVLLVVLKKTN